MTTVLLRFKYRIYPTVAQQRSIARIFGCARVVFNDGLRLRQDAHERGLPYISDGDLSKMVITEAKKGADRSWLSAAPAAVLQQALADLNAAYRNYFQSISGQRRGPRMGLPRFRSRKDKRQSVRFTSNTRFKVLCNGKLRLPKVGELKVRWSRPLPGTPSSVTVIRDSAGRHFASFVVLVDREPLPGNDREVGIDLGLSDFAVLSDGTKFAAPQFLRRAERKIRRLQRDLARKQRGSSNRAKARQKVARAHARVADTRRDWLHKLSTTIVRESQAVYVEDLAVSGLARTHLAYSVHDAGWAQFTAMLEYKAARYGRTFSKVGRWFPSTRTCSECGLVGGKRALHVRRWTCPCGVTHDRDVNAAKNIRAAGRADLNDRGAQVRPGLVPAQRREAVTRRKSVPSGDADRPGSRTSRGRQLIMPFGADGVRQ
ncbi:RNA-guided endonuclease TnpB family protein [Micromonospora sp. NPDC049081]|uniref:RNA-guided endonuclease InsQ/TnpB family protein n=1 Tax=Micromonospora sp. NPDC049081 TaxID=3155150 RepID=UPI0033D9E749